MITYRAFHNTDPPRIVALWEQSNLGPGAADKLTVDAFEFFVFAQPFFDKKGLIVAMEDDRVIGFVHAQPAVNESQSDLSDSAGAIVALLVHPDFRRQGVASQLLTHAQQYLTDLGLGSIELGPSDRTSGFYIGIYGGVSPNGFRESDGPMQLFAAKHGWNPARTYRCYQKDLSAAARPPVSMKLLANRRKTQLDASDPTGQASWWWMTRYGRMDSVQFNIIDKSSRQVYASCEVFGLDLYIPKWGQRAAGLSAINVPAEQVGNLYELSLLLEVSKYLREQLITIVDTCVDAEDAESAKLLESAGFLQCDVGTVFAPDATVAAANQAAAAAQRPGSEDSEQT